MERSELLEKLREDISWLGACETEQQIISHIEYAIKLLKEQPDIVRCKDCRNMLPKGYCRKNARKAPCKIPCEYYGNWFCADGRRKEQ